MKQITCLFITIYALIFSSCQKDADEGNYGSRNSELKKSAAYPPIQLGSIRGIFNGTYFEFNQQIEVVQPVDSFSNCYFYGDNPEIPVNQINLIRRDSNAYLAIFINGYPLDSLPMSQPVLPEFCKYSEIQFSPLGSFNWGPGNYVLDDFYGRSVFITDRTDDVLTGYFAGILHDSDGNTVEVTDGEFMIKIVRKYMLVDKKYSDE